MAFDLFTRKQNDRNWTRSRTLGSPLTTLPDTTPLETPTRLTDALATIESLNPGLNVKRRGKGAVVSKKWQW